MTEDGLDTIEIRLRRAMENALSRGDISEADEIDRIIRNLDYVPLCAETEHDVFDRIIHRHRR